MAHELTIRENGFTEMAFVGKTPWHGLGQALDENSTIEQWQVASGMDWTIKSVPVHYEVEDNNFHHNLTKFDGQNVLYRSDTGMPLSVVSDRYKPVQPQEVLEFFRDLVQENGFKIHTAGTLKGGKRLWALAETGKYGEVCKDDGIGGFLLLSTSCDRTLATTARFTTVRVVCNNTLSMAHKNDENMVSFSHITEFDHAMVKSKLGSAVESFGTFLETAKFLQSQQLGAQQASLFLKELLSSNYQVKKDEIEKNRSYLKILSLFDYDSKGLDLVGHTKWSMLNAVTEYVDHHNPSRSDDSRLDSAWFGTGDKMKDRAMNLLLA